MAIKLMAKTIVDKELPSLRERCERLKKIGIIPTMKVVLVGESPASMLYIRNKKKFCDQFGAVCEIVKLSEMISEEDFRKEIKNIIEDRFVHGCFVQLPLPKHLSHIEVGPLIPPHKDVDGFNSLNLARIIEGDKGENCFIPCTPKGVITILEQYGYPLAGKHVVMIGRSLIVGRPLAMLLTNYDATVTLCHSKTTDIRSLCRSADIIISAIGKPRFLDRSYIEGSHKKPIVIDIGMNYDAENNLCGDVDFESVFDLVEAITPVPGGTGPMTVFSLGQNLLQAAEKSI